MKFFAGSDWGLIGVGEASESLRGLDLNQRPLGYEPTLKLVRNCRALSPLSFSSYSSISFLPLFVAVRNFRALAVLTIQFPTTHISKAEISLRLDYRGTRVLPYQ